MRKYLYTNEKEIDYLFATPYCNGAEGILSNMGNKSKRVISSGEALDTQLSKMLDEGVQINNILFNNISNCSLSTRDRLERAGTKMSSYEQGWFPHYQTLHCDPLGFSSKSLLAKTRLGDIEIDLEKISNEITNYKKNYAKPEGIFKIDKPYVLLIFQHTGDATIKHDYKDFKSWQKIIDFADKVRGKGKTLVVKVNPQNVNSKEKIQLPHNSIAIQNKFFNNDLLMNAKVVIGVNSTMLYEASIIYNKPVLALGSSWFDCHPEVVQKVKITDDNVEIKKPSDRDIVYRKKMFHIMTSMQTPIHPNKYDLIEKHRQASSIRKISDWLK